MNEENQKSYVPAGLAAAAAIWLGINKRGSLLTDIAHASIGKVLYGGKAKQKQPQKAKKRSNRGSGTGTKRKSGS